MGNFLFPHTQQTKLYGLPSGQKPGSWPEHDSATVQATRLPGTQQDAWQLEAPCMAWPIATSEHPCLRLPTV